MNEELTEKEKRKKLVKIVLLTLVSIYIILSLAIFTWLSTDTGAKLKYFDKDVIFEKYYLPHKYLEWNFKYGKKFPLIFDQRNFFVFLGELSLLLILLIIGMKILRKPDEVSNLHGSARWANRKDLEKLKLINNTDGVYVGGFVDPKTNENFYLRENSPEHLLVFAPTRSGKGVGLILPTLLSWKHSCVVFDIKGENWALTSGWRQKFANNIVLKFDPTANDGSSAKFNPLAEIRLKTDHEVADAQNIAYMISDPEGKGMEGDNGHWQKAAYSLLTAVILHVCYEADAKGEEGNLPEVARFLSGADAEFQKNILIVRYGESGDKEAISMIDDIENQDVAFYYMVTTKHSNGEVHPAIQEEAQSMINKPDKEKGSIISTALTSLTLYRDKIIASNVTHSDFKINDLMNLEKPVSLYLVIPPNDAERLRPLLRLMITLFIRKLTSHMEFKDGKSVAHYKHRLLLMLDEFPALKKMPIVEEGLAYIAGYGIKAYLITQDLDQITALYGQQNGIVGNCNVRIAYAPNTLPTAKYLSELAGFTTVTSENISISGKRSDFSLNQVSKSINQTKRELITPDEVLSLPKPIIENNKIIQSGRMLIFFAGQPAIKGTQILYFKDPSFSARAKIEAPEKSDFVVETMRK